MSTLSSGLISASALVYYFKGMSLTREKVLSLLTAESPEEMKNALKGTWLEGLPIERMSPEELEREACKAYYQVLEKLRGYMPSKNLRDLVEIMRDYIRARDVMLILRSVLSGKEIDEIENLIVFKDDPVVQNLLLIARDRRLEGIGQALKGLKIAEYIEKALEMYRTYKDIAAFTIALDAMLLESLFTLTSRIGKSMNVGTNRIEFARLICPEVDVLSYVMIARAILRGEKVVVEPPACNKDILKQLEQARPEDIVPILRRSIYGTDLPDNVYEALSKLLVNGYRIQRKRAEAAFAGYPFRPAVILALMILYRLDARDVATIVTGKRAGLDISKIAEMLSFELISG